MDRLQKIISARGVMSRRAAEDALRGGRVSLNGETASLGMTAEDTDVITVDGEELPPPPRFVYTMLNKPPGVLTAVSDERGRRVVTDLTLGAHAKLLPVGRLDLASEGLLIMTNDNALIHKLTHPSSEIEKEYKVWTRGNIDIERLREPVDIDGKATLPADAELLEDGTLKFVIREGRNRQIRRVCERTGLKVLRLVRVREGGLTLGNLRAGSWRYLTDREIREIKELPK